MLSEQVMLESIFKHVKKVLKVLSKHKHSTACPMYVAKVFELSPCGKTMVSI